MKIVTDFVDGELSDNIMRAMSLCSFQQIAELASHGKFRVIKNDPNFTYRKLLYSALDDYADAAGCSMRYLLFGSDEIPVIHYTPVDQEVICALNALSEDELTVLDNAVSCFFQSDLMVSVSDLNPSERYARFWSTKLGQIPSVPESELGKYHLNVNMEIERYRSKNYPKIFYFNSDFWPDLANLAGISLRWVLGIKRHPIFCDRAKADDIFDKFTLMNPQNKKSFAGILIALCAEAPQPLQDYFLSGREWI